MLKNVQARGLDLEPTTYSQRSAQAAPTRKKSTPVVPIGPNHLLQGAAATTELKVTKPKPPRGDSCK